MSTGKKANIAINKISDQITNLQQIVEKVNQDLDTTMAFDRFRRWKKRSSMILCELVITSEVDIFNNLTEMFGTLEDPSEGLIRIVNRHLSFLRTLLEEINEHPEDILVLTSNDIVDKIKRKSVDQQNFIREMYKAANGSVNECPNMLDIGTKLGFNETYTVELAHYWKGEGWIEAIATNTINFSQYGVNECEKMLISLTEGNMSQSQPSEQSSVNSKAIFIVHGHDETNTLKLKNLLKSEFDLDSIILGAKAGKGRTIIEKFEQEAPNAGYAFAIFTPDDFIDAPKGKYYQARPNVIFELGWFCGKLGRDRTCILFKKGTKVHSDLDGIERIEFIDSVEEQVIKIKEELKAANLIDK